MQGMNPGFETASSKNFNSYFVVASCVFTSGRMFKAETCSAAVIRRVIHSQLERQLPRIATNWDSGISLFDLRTGFLKVKYVIS